MPGQPDIMGQVTWAMEREMAIHLDDILLRRTSVGLLGISEVEVVAVSEVMAEALNWTNTMRCQEVKTTLNRQTSFRQIVDDYYHG